MQSSPPRRRSRARHQMTGHGGAVGEAVAERALRSHYLNSGKVRMRCHWVLWVLSWSLLSLWIISFTSSQAVEMHREALADMCDERARMLEDHVRVTMRHLQALAILVSTFHHSKSPSAMDQATFARYAERTAFQRPLTSGLAYAARVAHAERELFERQQAWSIKMLNSSSSRRPPAEEYAPVVFAQDGYKHVVSLDVLSGDEGRENVLRARDSGKGVLTAPFKLFKSNRIGVVLTHAVYKSELPLNATAKDRIQSAIGYLGGIFDMEACVDELLQKLEGRQSIMVNVYDTTNKRPIRMFGSNGSTSGDDMCHVSTLNFGDPSRKHEMHCRFTQRPPWPWLAIASASSCGTLVVSLLVGCVIHFITGKRIAKVQEGADFIHEMHETIQGEQMYREDARFSPSPMELSHLGNNNIIDPQELEEIGDQEEVEEMNLRFEMHNKLNDIECNNDLLDSVTKFKELTSASIFCLSSRLRYLTKKLVSISLLGLVLYFIVNGYFDQPLFNQSLGMRRGDDKMVLNNFGPSHGRLLLATPHGTWAKSGVQGSDIIRVDLRKRTGSNDSSEQQKHRSSHNSSVEIPAVVYVTRNGEQVKIHCNVTADEKELANWISNGNTDDQASKSPKTTVGCWIALVSVIMLVLGTAVWLLMWCNYRRRLQRQELELLGGIMGPRRFQLHELASATSNFADDSKLGQGGFGPVYGGYLRDQDLHVAIKVLSEKQSSQGQSEQGLREFNAEVKVMTQVRHRNIVKLVGWCDSKNRHLLVYELMAQGSLDKHLYDPEKVLTWQQRFKIVLDLGTGLVYLHRDCEKCIVHGDIKPANVMLDVSHNAKLGDFGLARLVEHGAEPQTTQVVAGTPGYIDPEFINNRWPRTELDVYSFGVVLLEIACGKRPASRQPNRASSLLAWVHGLYDQGMVLDAADQRLNGEFDQQQVERVIVTGLWCAHRGPIQRPSIVQAMDVLRSADAELPVISAGHDARHICSMEEQAYADLPVEGHSVGAVSTGTYFTSKDSVYLLAEERRTLSCE